MRIAALGGERCGAPAAGFDDRSEAEGERGDAERRVRSIEGRRPEPILACPP